MGWANANPNPPHNGQTGVGPGPPLQNIGTPLGNWPDHSINSTNGWMPAAWGHQIAAPTTASRSKLLDFFRLMSKVLITMHHSNNIDTKNCIVLSVQ